MANEPDNVVLRLLREIRTTQQTHGEMLTAQGGSLSRLEKRVEDLYKISTHTLGVAVTAHERHEALEARLDQLSQRVDRLEAKQ
jgi:polyhydroxyalkanoate synthesis regulator phasin